MKKIIYLFIGFVLFSSKVQSQSYDTTQYYGKMNYVFHHVNKSLIPTGILRDYGIEFLNLDNYTGTVLHDSNFVALDEWRMLYTSLYSSQINSNANMLYLDTVNRLINKYNYTDSAISFIGLHYNYNKLKDYTLTNNLMTVSNEQLYDVSGRPESPYENKTIFAIAPIRQAAFTGSNNFIFRPQLFLGNTGKTISSIAYKKQGAGSYQTVAFNTPFTISYDSTGFYNLDIKITYTDYSIVYGHTKIVVYENPNSVGARYGTVTTPATNETVTATKAYLGQLATGDITIDLAANNTTGQIRKPLIVVEGFDADNSWGYNGADGLVPRLNRDINDNNPLTNPITLNFGLDDINEYDLIFLNFANGTDFIQRNAFLLERVIEIVNSRKTTWNGTRQDNVIIGMSMGGLVARYALRDMELNSEDHETRLFISHDAPHWGANIPVGLQAAVQHLGPWQIINVGGQFPWISWVDMFPAVADALDMFNSPAAQQMLIQRYTLSGQNLTANNSVHNTFLNELNTMGWPQNSKNLTLSNGSCNGTKQFPNNSTIFTLDGDRSMTYFGSLWRSLIMTLAGGSTLPTIATGGNPQFNQWALLWQFPLSLFSTSSSIGLDFKVRAVPSSGTQEIYRGDIYSKKKILWVINVKNYFIKCHVNSNTGMLPLDNAPGGVYDVNEFGIDPNMIASQMPSFFNGYVTSSVLQPRFCFIPTVSSLAITNPSNYLTSNICATVNCLNNSGVQNYFAPQVNELHISYTQTSTNWILAQQDPTTNCVKVCASNLTISGPNSFCTTSGTYSITNLPTGATVSWSILPYLFGGWPSGAATINTPNSPTTTLTKTTDGVFILRATISNVCGVGTVQLQKQIAAGPPLINILGPYDPIQHTIMGVACVGEEYYFIANDSETGQTYTWTLFPPTGSSEYPRMFSGSQVQFDFVVPGYHTLRVAKTNSCGTTYTEISINVQECFGFRLSASPNPATDQITATIDEETKAVKTLSPDTDIRFELYNFNTGLRQRQWIFKNNQNQFRLSLSGLNKGVYVLNATKGKYKQSIKVIVN